MNTVAVLLGLSIYPSAIIVGIHLAKQSKTNLYYAKENYDELLGMPVDGLGKRNFKLIMKSNTLSDASRQTQPKAMTRTHIFSV